MRAWIPAPDSPIPEPLRQAVGGSLLVARLLSRRGFQDAPGARAFLDPKVYSPAPAEALPGTAEAAERLLAAVEAGDPICVWGDFDADGQTATTLLVSVLRDIGARVSFHIPVREHETHGVGLPALQEVLAAGARVILTCDTGVSAHEAVDEAHRRGVQFIITDHHALPTRLPDADALVNPRLLPEAHPLSGLPGVGVAYKLAEALYARLGRPEAALPHLDLVALGIVADVAPVRADNRYLLQRGLETLRRRPRPGLRHMLELANLDPARLTEEHIGFVIGPRLNAIGRLADANPVVELLTTNDPVRARILALQLESLNTRRRLLSDQVFQAAQAQIEREPKLLDPPALVLSHPAWPAGVIGIAASRLVELYQRPVILIAAPPDQPARGSARSVEGIDITAAIADQRDLLLGFGGHPMAAGLSLDPQRIPEFQRGLSRSLAFFRPGEMPEVPLVIDETLSLAALTAAFAADLERLAPFGPGNPAPVLASRGLVAQEVVPVGRNGEHLSVTLRDLSGALQKAIWWQAAGSRPPQGAFDLAYTARLSDYRGQPRVEVEWIEARQVEELQGEIRRPATPVRIRDCRGEKQPGAVLETLREGGEILIWREGQDVETVPGCDRAQLRPAAQLAIWTAPPGNAELQEALERVRPQEIVLFAHNPGLDRPEAFIRQLASLVKFTLRAYQGRASLLKLAGATGQRVETVKTGLEWLAARGVIQVQFGPGEEAVLSSGGSAVGKHQAALQESLLALLEETAAYREYFARAETCSIIGQRA